MACVLVPYKINRYRVASVSLAVTGRCRKAPVRGRCTVSRVVVVGVGVDDFGADGTVVAVVGGVVGVLMVLLLC